MKIVTDFLLAITSEAPSSSAEHLKFLQEHSLNPDSNLAMKTGLILSEMKALLVQFDSGEKDMLKIV